MRILMEIRVECSALSSFDLAGGAAVDIVSHDCETRCQLPREPSFVENEKKKIEHTIPFEAR